MKMKILLIKIPLKRNSLNFWRISLSEIILFKEIHLTKMEMSLYLISFYVKKFM